MKRMMGGAALAAVVMTLAPMQAEGQAGMRGQRGVSERDFRPGVEAVMRLRDRLELTEGQLSQLESLREAVVQHRIARAAEMEEVRSQRQATPRDLDDPEARREQWGAFREQAEARRDAARAFSQGIRAQVESILTDEQKEELGDLMERARAFQRGRAVGMRGGQGVRSGRAGVSQGRGFDRGRAWGARNGRGPERMNRPGRGFRRGGGDGPPS